MTFSAIGYISCIVIVAVITTTPFAFVFPGIDFTPAVMLFETNASRPARSVVTSITFVVFVFGGMSRIFGICRARTMTGCTLCRQIFFFRIIVPVATFARNIMTAGEREKSMIKTFTV